MGLVLVAIFCGMIVLINYRAYHAGSPTEEPWQPPDYGWAFAAIAAFGAALWVTWFSFFDSDQGWWDAATGSIVTFGASHVFLQALLTRRRPMGDG